MANYCTAAELRTQIEKTGTTGSGSDAALGVIIEAASRAIDHYCNRPDGFISASGTRYYTGQGRPYLLIDECTSITSVAVKDSATDTTYTTWTNGTDYQAASGDPEDPDWNSLPYNMLIVLPVGSYAVFTSGEFITKRGFSPTSDVVRGSPTVKVVANFGYAATTAPASIKQACIALSARWFKQGQGAWADTLASPELGQLIYRKENVDIQMMLMRYVKPAVGLK